jgi:hypothetical protein
MHFGNNITPFIMNANKTLIPPVLTQSEAFTSDVQQVLLAQPVVHVQAPQQITTVQHDAKAISDFVSIQVRKHLLKSESHFNSNSAPFVNLKTRLLCFRTHLAIIQHIVRNQSDPSDHVDLLESPCELPDALISVSKLYGDILHPRGRITLAHSDVLVTNLIANAVKMFDHPFFT